MGRLQAAADMNGDAAVALTRSFKTLVQTRAAGDPAFAEALLGEGVNALLSGEVDLGKALLRDYIAATVGFEKLGEVTGTEAGRLARMFGSRSNPQARNLFGIIGHLQRQTGVTLQVLVGSV